MCVGVFSTRFDESERALAYDGRYSEYFYIVSSQFIFSSEQQSRMHRHTCGECNPSLFFALVEHFSALSLVKSAPDSADITAQSGGSLGGFLLCSFQFKTHHLNVARDAEARAKQHGALDEMYAYEWNFTHEITFYTSALLGFFSSSTFHLLPPTVSCALSLFVSDKSRKAAIFNADDARREFMTAYIHALSAHPHPR